VEILVSKAGERNLVKVLGEKEGGGGWKCHENQKGGAGFLSLVIGTMKCRG